MAPGNPEPTQPTAAEILRDRLALVAIELNEKFVDFRPDLLEELDSDE